MSEKYGLPRYIVHQAYYSLLDREYEWELLPLAVDQKVGTFVWSPLSGGKLAGKVRRGQPLPEVTRLRAEAQGDQIEDERLFAIVDVLDAVAAETGKTVSQVAINWLLQRPTVVSIILGARTEDQLRENLGAIGWTLTSEQVTRLETASDRTPDLPLLAPAWDDRHARPR